MKKKKITFVTILKDGSERKVKQNRDEVITFFSELAEKYPENNEISKQLLRVLPKISRIVIPVDDLNRDIPFILYRINDSTKIMEIPRCHKICWNKLKKFGKK